MPRAAAYALTWSVEHKIYELRQQGSAHPLHIESENWCTRIADCLSFAFHGQHGHLTLRRETRQHGGEGYWYAYRNHGQKTLKRYVGRTVDLTIARLEEIAGSLNARPELEKSTREGQVPGLSPILNDPSQRELPSDAIPIATRQRVPLLTSKLSLPRLPADLVSRERLLARLNAGLESKLTLLCSPAGFGKTTLALQWLTSLNGQDKRPGVAWVSLDAGDNDPVRFWSYAITACRTLHNDVGRTALALLPTEQSPFEPLSLETSLALLLNELSQVTGKSVLVLEDYHAITSPQIHASLVFLLDHLPATFHIVMITRAEPPLPLARLRASNAVNEVGAGDLRLSRHEMQAFLQQTLALSPSPETIAHLDAQIEGWVTGLRLLTLALQRHPNEQPLEQRLATFSSSRRHLLDYFVTEVLATQPEEIQTFLLQTSELNGLTAPLCDAVTGRTDSERILRDLERVNLFLLPFDGNELWYRYHPLFAEALRYEAQRRLNDETRCACFERASIWYERHGLLTEAIEMALAATAFTRAAALIEQITGPQRFHEMREHHTLHRWLDALPSVILEQHPTLCLTLAMVLLFASDCQVSVSAEVLAQIEQSLRMAERAWQVEEDRGGLGEVLAFRVVIARFQGELAQATNLARQALVWLPESAEQWRATCLNTIGDGELLNGRPDAARQAFLTAHSCFEAAGNHYGQRVVLLALGEICSLQGKLHQAATLYQEVLHTAGEDLSDKGKALLGLTRLSYEWNRLDTAENQAREALQIGLDVGDEALQAQASLILAYIQHAHGQLALARQQISELLARAQMQKAPLLYREVLAREVHLQLVDGDLATAHRWLAAQTVPAAMLSPMQQEQEKLLTARLLIGRDKAGEALNLLTCVRDNAREHGRARDEMEAQILIALALGAQQNLPQAWQHLSDVLALAHTEGYLRLFLDEGEQMAALLRAVFPLSGKPFPATYIRTLLLAFSRQQFEQFTPARPGTSLAIPSIEPLSPQERRVLTMLVAGFSNGEIAESLVVSTNTVKTQVQSVYRKLNVHSRKEAREAMRAQNAL